MNRFLNYLDKRPITMYTIKFSLVVYFLIVLLQWTQSPEGVTLLHIFERHISSIISFTIKELVLLLLGIAVCLIFTYLITGGLLGEELHKRAQARIKKREDKAFSDAYDC